jgi:plastocyanin
VKRLSIAFAAGTAMLLSLAPSASSAAAAAPTVHVIEMDKLKFGPVPAGLRVGDTIRWVNKDIFRHTATARDGSFNVDLQPGASGTTKLTKAGAIAFFCRYHPGMTGQLTVAK